MSPNIKNQFGLAIQRRSTINMRNMLFRHEKRLSLCNRHTFNMDGHWTYILEWIIQLVAAFATILICLSHVISSVSVHSIAHVWADSKKAKSLAYKTRLKELYSGHHL